MILRGWMCAILALVCSSALRAESAQKTTRQLLNKLGDDLAAAWQEYPSEKQKESREAQIKAINDAFSKAILTAEVPANQTVSKIISAFLESVDKSRMLFKVEKMFPTRTIYITACTAAIKREAPSATDRAQPRTTQQCFEMMMTQLEQARDQLRQVPPDIQATCYGQINEIMTGLLKDAKVSEKEKADAVSQMEQNLKEARRTFPTNSPALQKINEKILQLMEAMAKEIQNKALTK